MRNGRKVRRGVEGNEGGKGKGRGGKTKDEAKEHGTWGNPLQIDLGGRMPLL
jgi:hypothetical protein